MAKAIVLVIGKTRFPIGDPIDPGFRSGQAFGNPRSGNEVPLNDASAGDRFDPPALPTRIKAQVCFVKKLELILLDYAKKPQNQDQDQQTAKTDIHRNSSTFSRCW